MSEGDGGKVGLIVGFSVGFGLLLLISLVAVVAFFCMPPAFIRRQLLRLLNSLQTPVASSLSRFGDIPGSGHSNVNNGRTTSTQLGSASSHGQEVGRLLDTRCLITYSFI